MNEGRKRFAALLAPVVAAASLAAAGCAAGSSLPPLKLPHPGQPTPYLEYTFSADTSGLPTTATVYRFDVRQPRREEVEALARKFMAGGDLVYDPVRRVYRITHGKQEFEYEVVTGHWCWFDREVLHNSSIIKVVPGEEEAKEIAREFLVRRDLLPEGFQVSGVGESSTGDVLTGNYRVLGRDVYFGRVVEGRLVLGVSRLVVMVGDQGRIEAVRKYFKEIRPDRTVDLRPVEEALGEVRANLALHNISPFAEQAEIARVALAYWEDPGPPSDQPYLQPIWLFEGKALVEGKYESFNAVVPAAAGVASSPL